MTKSQWLQSQWLQPQWLESLRPESQRLKSLRLSLSDFCLTKKHKVTVTQESLMAQCITTGLSLWDSVLWDSCLRDSSHWDFIRDKVSVTFYNCLSDFGHWDFVMDKVTETFAIRHFRWKSQWLFFWKRNREYNISTGISWYFGFPLEIQSEFAKKVKYHEIPVLLYFVTFSP